MDRVEVYKLRKIFSVGTKRVIPSEQDSIILSASVANDRARFDSPCSLTGIEEYNKCGLLTKCYIGYIGV